MNLVRASWAPGFLVLAAIVIIVSSFSALVWRHSVVVAALSIGIFWLVWTRWKISERVPVPVALACLLFFLMAVHSFLLIHSLVDASADATPVVATLVLNEKIPETYGAYSSLRFSYYIGWPLFVREFLDLFPVVPAHVWMWFLTAVLLALQPLLVFLIVRDFHSEKAGVLASVLFLANKAVFTDFFAGEYPFVAGFTFFLAFAWLFLKKNPLSLLFFPVLFLVHPAVAFLALFFLVVYHLFFGIERATVWKLGLAGVLSFPAFLVTYVALWNAFWGGYSFSGGIFDIEQGLFLLRTLLFWIGLPLWIALVSLAVWSRKPDRQTGFWVALLVLSIAGFAVFSMLGSLLGYRMVEFVAFAGIPLAVVLLSRIPSKWFSHALFLLAVLALVLFFSSGYLNEQRKSHRMLPDQYEFAFAFKQAVPEKTRTLFVAGREGRGTGKMALLSDKIPFDVFMDTFLPQHPVLAGNDPALETIRKNHELNLRINNGCVECIEQTNAELVVVQKSVFPFELPYPTIFEFKDYLVYRRTPG